MNAMLASVTIGALRNNLSEAEVSYRHSDVLVDERMKELRTAKLAAKQDPCDFNKARVQSVTAEVDEAIKNRASCKEDLRRAGEAVRVFKFRAKPAITASGKAMRH